MSSSGGIGSPPRGVTTSGEGLTQAVGDAQAQSANVGAAQIAPDGKVLVNGVPVDVNTPEGAAILMGAVNTEELETIKGMLLLKQVDSPDGPLLIPDDSFKKADTTALRAQLGPTANEGGDWIDNELGQWFESQGVANPYNSNTTPALYDKIKDNGAFLEAVAKLTGYLQNPTTKAEGEFISHMAAIEGQNVTNAAGTQTQYSPEFVKYMKGIQAANPHGNIMELLFLVFRQSIEETNEDKKYFLQKLKMFNDMGESLSNYLSDLVDVSRDLGAAAAGAKYPEMVLTAEPVTIKKFDLSTTNRAGELVPLSVESKKLERAGLNDTIKEVESMQETVRNKRQMASTAFQNFDQKSNQLYNLLSSVMKAMNEMRMGTVRNML